MSTQAVGYANGVITLSKRDGTTKLFPFNVENEAAAGWTNWTPVYATGFGNAATSFTVGGVTTFIARWKRIGKRVTVDMHFQATAAAGIGPDELYASLPAEAGLPYSVDAANNRYARSAALVTNVAAFEAAIIRAVVVAGVGTIKFARMNNVAWANGVVVGGHVNGFDFEVI